MDTEENKTTNYLHSITESAEELAIYYRPEVCQLLGPLILYDKGNRPDSITTIISVKDSVTCVYIPGKTCPLSLD